MTHIVSTASSSSFPDRGFCAPSAVLPSVARFFHAESLAPAASDDLPTFHGPRRSEGYLRDKSWRPVGKTTIDLPFGHGLYNP